MKKIIFILLASISLSATAQTTTYLSDTTFAVYPLVVEKKQTSTGYDKLKVDLSSCDSQIRVLKNDLSQLTEMVLTLQSQSPVPNQFFIVRQSSDAKLSITVGDDNTLIVSQSINPVSVVLGNLPAGVRLWIRRNNAEINLPTTIKSKSGLRRVQANGTIQLTSEGNGVWSVQGDLR